MLTAWGTVRDVDGGRLPEGEVVVAAGDATVAVTVDPDTGRASIR